MMDTKEGIRALREAAVEAARRKRPVVEIDHDAEVVGVPRANLLRPMREGADKRGGWWVAGWVWVDASALADEGIEPVDQTSRYGLAPFGAVER